MFKHLLLRLSTENTFMVVSKFCKQRDRWTMGRPLFVVFSDLHMTNTENEVLYTSKQNFCKHFVDDIINRRQGIKTNLKKLLEKTKQLPP